MSAQPQIVGGFAYIAVPMAKKNVPMTPVLPNSKKAFLPDFPTTATTDLGQIYMWDALYRNHNGACVARAEEGGVFFFEVDSPDVLNRIKAETGHDLLNEVPTFRVRSRKSRGHFYFRHNAESLARLSNISQTYVKCTDWSLRVNRQYVIAANSVHPDTGEPYQALNWDAPILEAPQWLIDWLLSQKIQKVEGKKEVPRNERGKVDHGKIHGFMLTQAGRLRNAGLIQSEIEEALLRIVHCNALRFFALPKVSFLKISPA
jgi:hypothetical protein